MSNQVWNGVKVFAALVALGVFALGVSFTFHRLLPAFNKVPTTASLPPTTEATAATTRPAAPTSTPTAQPAPTIIPFPPYDGLIVFVSEAGGMPQIYRMRPDGSGVTQLTQPPVKPLIPAWSPDGKWIAFDSTPIDNVTTLLSMNPDGSGQTQLTKDPNFSGYYYWSPDSRKIAYTSLSLKDPKDVQLFVMNADGSGKTELPELKGPGKFLGWSPDSRQIVYTLGDPDATLATSVNIINADGTGQLKLASQLDGVTSIQWQDDRYFYGATSNGSDQWRLYLFSTEGTAPVQVASTGLVVIGSVPTWFLQGSNPVFITNSYQNLAWYRVEGTQMTLLAERSDYAGRCKTGQDNNTWMDLSPDRSLLLVSTHCSEGGTWLALASADGAWSIPLQISIRPQIVDVAWSPNGQYVLLTLGDDPATPHDDLYLLDVGKALKDPTSGLMPLTSDNAWKYDAAWQPEQ